MPIFCLTVRDAFSAHSTSRRTLTGKACLDMLESWLLPQLADVDVQGYIYQQDVAPPHWHKKVRGYLNEHLPGRWAGRAAATHLLHLATPVTGPDSVWFLPVAFRQAQCLRPIHFQRHYQNCRERIGSAIGNGTQDMLERVRRGWEYWLDYLPCHTWGAHRMHLRLLWNCKHFSFKWW